MTRRLTNEAGFSVLELLVALAVMSVAVGGASTLLVENSRVNKRERLNAEVQANARTCLAAIVRELGSAGWDPVGLGIDPVAVDPDLDDEVSQIEIFADRNGDATIDGPREQTLIRHVEDRVEWRPGVDAEFETLAPHITNDRDGDGTIEPMFETFPAGSSRPTRIRVQITARSPVPVPGGDPIRFTVATEVALRNASGS